MANEDISRFLFQPAKHYIGARAQQGRVILDSDFNENEQFDDEDLRRDLLNVIGTPGTPQEDPGFAVTDVVSTGGLLNFTISAGTIYIGGLRFRIDQDQLFLKQTDFLQLAKEDIPVLAPTDTEKRYEVVVEAFEQTVTAVEDRELLERALGAGGPDTSVRVRRTVRVRAVDVTAGAPDNCATGFEVFQAFLPTSGQINAESEFIHAVKMTVGFTGTTAAQNLCNPTSEGGYLGAENQAIRVMGVTLTSFVWGFDNASPLYAVDMSSDGQTVTMLDRPRDQASEPLTGQIVEILPASAVLPNGEVVAGLTGQLARVVRGFDPDDGTLLLTPGAVDLTKFVHGTDFNGFPSYPGAGVPTSSSPFFMRVWNQGSVLLDTTDSPTIPIPLNTFVDLGDTGLKVKFDSFVTPGAFWVIAARPESRQDVIPRSLLTGEPPMGTRKFYAPIAFIRWTPDQDPIVTDCRTPFPPLTAVTGCCNFRVGDGDRSFGNFNNLQQALDALPVEGGQICLLPGTHHGAVNISNRSNITISGCGKRSVLVGDGPSDFHGTGPEPEPVLLICDSVGIRLESFAVNAVGRAGIHVQMNTTMPSDIKLFDLDVFGDGVTGDFTTFVMPVNAVHVNLARNFEMANCRIKKATFLPSFYPAAFLNVQSSRIFDNDIGDVDGSAEQFGWQGLQLGSQSFEVEVFRNRINGGFGHGITLGHVAYRPTGATTIPFPERIVPIGLALGGGNTNPLQLGFIPQQLSLDLEGSGTPTPHDPFVSAILIAIRIYGNRIQGAALSGISVAGFFTDGQTFLVFDLQVRDNVIEQNALFLHLLPPLPLTQANLVGMGGVALGSVLVGDVSDNVIVGNGSNETAPIAGVVALVATDLTVSGNRIENNGPTTGAVAVLGLRGGVVVALAVRLNGPILGPGEGAFPIARSLPTVRIMDNTIVHPDGKAVFMNAFGPVEVQDNYLENHGDTTNAAILGLVIELPELALAAILAGASASCVQILNFAVPLDSFPFSFEADTIVVPGVPVTFQFIQNGSIRFNDNHVVLDWFQTRPRFFVFGTVILTGDHLSYQDNHVTTNMHNSQALVFVPPRPPTTEDLFTLFGRFLPNQSMGVASALLVGTGVTVSGNRFVEGQTDTALSAIVSSLNPSTPPAPGQPPPLIYPAIVTENISTHCMVVQALTFTFENNFTVYIPDCGDFGSPGSVELPPPPSPPPVVLE